MKREIKFNYLVQRDNGFSFNKTFTLDEIQNGVVTSWLSVNMVNNYIRREFTGLHDKNGREVYEGDILKITTKYGYSEIGQIIYKINTARFGFLSPDGSVYGLCTNDKNNEVIGNIYENGDLLNE